MAGCVGPLRPRVENIRVLIVDDHVLVRTGLRRLPPSLQRTADVRIHPGVATTAGNQGVASAQMSTGMDSAKRSRLPQQRRPWRALT